MSWLPLSRRSWRWRAFFLGVGLCCGLVAVTLTLAAAGDTRGGRVRLTAVAVNRSSVTRAVQVKVLLRGKGTPKRGRTVGRKALRALRAHGRAKVRVDVVLPRNLPPRSYRVVMCGWVNGRRAACADGRRRLGVIARGGGTPAVPPGGAGTAPGSGPPGQPPAPGGEGQTPPSDPAPAPPPKGTVHQTIDGFGTSSRVFDDPHVFDAHGAPPVVTGPQREDILQALYGELRLTRIRPVQPETTVGPPKIGIEIANDNDDPLVTDATRLDFSGRRLDDHAAQVIGARAQGVTTAWTSPLNREPWMGVAVGTDDAAEYAEWLLAQVRRFRDDGTPLQYVAIANEPSFTRNTMSGAFIRDVIKHLGPRMEAEGLLVPIVLPDDVRASAAAAKAAVVLADPAARRYVGALATHLYDEPLVKVAELRKLADTYDLPLWMTEFSLGAMPSMRPSGAPAPTPLDWALLMHELLATYDVAAIDYMWGYIGAGLGERFALLDLQHDDTTYRGFTRTKVFYLFGQYSRYVAPGAVRVSSTSSNPVVKVTTFFRGRDRTVVLINPETSPATTTVTAADLAGVPELAQTRTSASENWAPGPAVPVTGDAATVTLPPQSVATLSGSTG
ncbi:MAG: hypothetical protein HZB46_03910 [Solirubrobacterales bacterium]|nr:hypothetical protein [Solirubrobacterales bacterium]